MKADYARTGSWVIDNGLNGNGTVFSVGKGFGNTRDSGRKPWR